MTQYCLSCALPNLSQALLDKLAIEREQARLEAENKDLQTMVKQASRLPAVSVGGPEGCKTATRLLAAARGKLKRVFLDE